MSEKPEALRLAHELDAASLGIRGCLEALSAAELRRLHADNERLTAKSERMINAALNAQNAAIDLAQQHKRLTAEIERLREELRQSSIDHTRAEVERLKAERDEAVRAEREACAKVCESMARPVSDEMMSSAQWTATSCATAIRARGQEPPR